MLSAKIQVIPTHFNLDPSGSSFSQFLSRDLNLLDIALASRVLLPSKRVRKRYFLLSKGIG